MNGTVQNLKEAWQKMPGKTKKMIAVIAAGTIILAAAGLLVLNIGTKKGYSTLFTGMSSDDAQAVVSLLQDEGVDYRYNDKNGSVQVMSDTVDKTRAELLSKGYPKSGFTYDMYRNNAGIMSTEKDKEKYTLYELQDRLGAQIGLFEGVRDAKVTIAEGGTQKYALDDTQQTDASASVVVTMDPGQDLTDTKAAAIKNLIARAVKGMNFTNVSVFDAATMMEVGGEEEAGNTAGTGKDVAELTSQVEKSIAGNVRRVLELMYGQGKVAVSVKGTLNMQKLIQETVQYTTPDKVDQNDKTGLLEKEETAGENTGSTSSGNGGAAGADANADTPRYTGQTGTQVLWSSFFVTLVAKKIVLINLCYRPCFIWGSITIITVWTNMIIINVCKFFYLLIECFLCCKLIQICAFILQGIEVTLHRCIVVRIPCFAHALCHIYRFAEFGKCFGRIL